MICSQCEQEFNQASRDKILPTFFELETPDFCITCIVKSLEIKKSSLFQPLKTSGIVRDHLKAAYILSAEKFVTLNQQYRELDYDYNMIQHNIFMDKQRVKKASTKSPASKKTVTKTIEALLKNLPKEQRAVILAKFKTQAMEN